MTCGAAIDLWRNARKTEILSAQEEIAAVKNLVGYQHLHLNESEQSAMKAQSKNFLKDLSAESVIIYTDGNKRNNDRH